ncbi:MULTISPECIES: hypothetical protein [Ensifer]|jgi:hypothetical protein|uniref:Uncharacterized protein n=1 Tax=Ensifer canadensis TaxID=555315 RepID=A0AAW4FM81_9HYPH|nr:MULTISPECIES: hypothetical protein [Ensifer]MDP9628353.1 hypothetical protein [Ensifer adhaerens]MBD9486223.1 hypothetical protein [Ensifer sp. ENS11]MBM3091025.1 hypothetical protein [Ensifer canadensis]NOV15493.1 hypothetical protein [Ensifer canadensis]UBI75918.1 hypothetical protein J3R84_01780 [Ensifer canadensis]
MFLDNLKRFCAGKRRTSSATPVFASQGKSGTYGEGRDPAIGRYQAADVNHGGNQPEHAFVYD